MNSNPATIMTDPELADATYIEPLLPGPAAQVIERERPDALLPTLGGQTALNLAKALHDDGTLERCGVELIGANYEAIACAEDRKLFGAAMADAGLRMPASAIASGWDDELRRVDVKRGLAQALDALPDIGLPCIVRPAYTLGGRGGGIARTPEEFRTIVARGLEASPIGQVLIDQSVMGWGEFELEVMRDRADNVVIVCSIENIDPMGVHTGDSVTVAPQQTLPDRLYQRLRDQALTVIRAVGVETGGSNVQFAVNPTTEEVLVIEMNPRVSRSSALASKATGFPIAKIAARLAVGYLLEEIPNDITRLTPACFEPTIDYVVVKWPRFAFEKFPGAESDALHAHEVGGRGDGDRAHVRTGVREGAALTGARQAAAVGRRPRRAAAGGPARPLPPSASRRSSSFSAAAWRSRRCTSARRSTSGSCASCTRSPKTRTRRSRASARSRRWTHARRSSPRRPLTTTRRGSARRHPSFAPQKGTGNRPPPLSPWRGRAAARCAPHEVRRGERSSVVILGAGPNRIGQGIEFDYCCVHAAMTVRESGRDAVMINCNPETVSTDYDTSDRLYFEPLTLEDVLGVVEVEQPEGVIVQFGGQTPLKLAAGLADAGVPLLGTSVEAIDLAEDRSRFGELLGRLGYQAPPYATACSVDEALQSGEEVGYPLLVRPSYVLGGRAMEIVYSREGLADYLRREVGEDTGRIFLDRFLENAIELDVDALCDGKETWIGGIMQHVEEAGVHSGDSACVLPPHSLGGEMLDQVRAATRELALEIGVVGLLNVQYAVVDGQLYVIEANPRASRTVPFVSKAVGLPLAKLACRVMLGESISALNLPREREGLGFGDHVSVKEAVLPFDRFEGSDAVLGPEMRSTGEVMGIARDFPTAFAKAQAAAGCPLPLHGTVFISVTDADKAGAFAIAERLHENGFRILATRGTAEAIARMGIPAQALNKVSEGSPHVLDWIERGDVDLVVNTPTGSGARTDGWQIRRAAVTRGVPCLTTLAAGVSAARAISSARQNGPPPVLCLQELHRGGRPPISDRSAGADAGRPGAGVA